MSDEEIHQAILKQMSGGPYPVEMIYGEGTAGEQIARILATIPLNGTQKRITY